MDKVIYYVGYEVIKQELALGRGSSGGDGGIQDFSPFVRLSSSPETVDYIH